MRIALDMMLVAPGVAGGRVYCEELIRGLAAVDRANEYLLYTRRDVEPLSLPPSFRSCRAPVSGRSFVWRTLWEYGRLPRVVRNAGAAVFHGLGNVAPAVRSCPFVLTVHDMTHRRFPESFPLGYNLFLKYVQPHVARRAARVIVPSRYSAEDVVRYLRVREERIRVVPYGPGNAFQQITDGHEISRVLQPHGIRRPYLISVARAYAHKNLAGLLRAFARLLKMGHADLQLVLVGERYRAGDRLQRLTAELGLTENVVFTPRDSACRFSKRWPAACQLCRPTRRCCRRPWVTPASWPTHAIRTPSPPPWSES
jgi:glycosyltransferase involved in cell wall biosynthesis